MSVASFRSLSMKSKNRLTCDVFDISAANAGLLYVTDSDTDGWVRKWQHSRWRDFQTSIFNEQDELSDERERKKKRKEKKLQQKLSAVGKFMYLLFTLMLRGKYRRRFRSVLCSSEAVRATAREERERERERERESERDRERQRQTDRQRQRETERETETERGRDR